MVPGYGGGRKTPALQRALIILLRPSLFPQMSHPPGIGVTGMAVCVVGLHLAGAFVRPLKAIGYRWNEAVDALRSRVPFFSKN